MSRMHPLPRPTMHICVSVLPPRLRPRLRARSPVYLRATGTHPTAPTALLSPPTMHLRSDLSFQPLPPAVCLSNDKLPSLADVEAFSSAFHVHPPGPAIRLRLRLSFFRDFTSAHDDAALPSSQTHGTVVIRFVGRNPHHWQTVAVPLSALSFVDVSLF